MGWWISFLVDPDRTARAALDRVLCPAALDESCIGLLCRAGLRGCGCGHFRANAKTSMVAEAAKDGKVLVLSLPPNPLA